MGILDRLASRRTYLDVNVFIYALEAHPQYLSLVTDLFTAIDSGTIHAVTSELTLAEALVKPFMDKRQYLQALYQQAIATRTSLTVPSVTRDILIESARIRAEHPVRLPDAIHLATARSTACPVFLTNDHSIPSLTDIEVILLSDLLSPRK